MVKRVVGHAGLQQQIQRFPVVQSSGRVAGTTNAAL
jgi:hypothetical protein